MKLIAFIFSLLFMSSAMAHTDHVLGDGSLHTLYHAVFWGLFALIVFKGVTWFTSKSKREKSER